MQTSNALLKLCAFHKGEVVEISPCQNKWILAEGAHPTPQQACEEWHEQFLCLPKEAKADASSRQPLAASACNVGTGNSVLGRWEYGQLAPWDADIERRAVEAARLLGQSNSGDLYPEWKQQTLRCLVPCRRTNSYHWRRACSCITLGRLFGVLGQAYSADAIYHFYRTRRIVVAKQKKEDGLSMD